MLWDSELIPYRIILTMSEVFWAILLLWPGEIFSRPIYTHMAKVVSENMLGVIFLASATIQLGIVLSDKLHSTFARIFAFWQMLLLCYVMLSMLFSVYPPPASIGGEIVISIISIWIWIRPYILVEGYIRAVR